MFEHVPVAPPDPILGLNETFAKDPRAEKINLSVGVFKDEEGRTPVLNSVKEAERRLVECETTKNYLGIDGLETYNAQVRKLLFGSAVPAELTATAQVPGGTAGVRLAAEFVADQLTGSRVWISNPTWVNHNSIFEAAGVEVVQYPYLSADKTKLDFSAMMDALRSNARPRDTVLLHACCHNPTGVDPTTAQWRELAQLLAEKQLLPIVDFAYQGFGDGLTEDAVGLLEIQKQTGEVLIASSFSKNFGLYSERVGALTAVTKSAANTAATLSQMKRLVRAIWSNPPRHGGAIVATILSDEGLTKQWKAELDAMRHRIAGMRREFVEQMRARTNKRDFGFLMDQKGMFSFSGLSPLQVDRLKSEFAVYLVGSGRINVAGMTPKNLPQLCDAITAVL